MQSRALSYRSECLICNLKIVKYVPSPPGSLDVWLTGCRPAIGNDKEQVSGIRSHSRSTPMHTHASLTHVDDAPHTSHMAHTQGSDPMALLQVIRLLTPYEVKGGNSYKICILTTTPKSRARWHGNQSVPLIIKDNVLKMWKVSDSVFCPVHAYPWETTADSLPPS